MIYSSEYEITKDMVLMVRPTKNCMDNYDTDNLQIYGEGSSFRGQIKDFVRTVVYTSPTFMPEPVVDGKPPMPFTTLTKQRIEALLMNGEFLNGIPDSKVFHFIQLYSSLIYLIAESNTLRQRAPSNRLRCVLLRKVE
jgi:hypothetical protein